MRSLFKLLPLFVVVLLSFGCSETDESQKVVATAKPQPPPVFKQTDDPKVFFQSYLDDLNGGEYMPQSLVDVLNDSDIPTMVEKIGQHHTTAFIEWYYAEDYLKHVRKLVDMKVSRMDYQLNVKGISKEDAAEALLVIDAGPLEHKLKSMDGTIEQEWIESQEGDHLVSLSMGRWQQTIRVLKEDGAWKMGILEGQ